MAEQRDTQLLARVAKAIRFVNHANLAFRATSSHPNQVVLTDEFGANPLFIEKTGERYRLYNEGSECLFTTTNWRKIVSKACAIFYADLVAGMIDELKE